MNRIRANFLWAFIYNVCAIPYAAGAFYPWNRMQLSPMIAAILMFVSSISVVVSSYLLNRFKKVNYHSTGSGPLEEVTLQSIRTVDGFTELPQDTPSLTIQPPTPEPVSPGIKSKNPSQSINWQPLRTRHVSISGASISGSDEEDEVDSDHEESKTNNQIELQGLLPSNYYAPAFQSSPLVTVEP